MKTHTAAHLPPFTMYEFLLKQRTDLINQRDELVHSLEGMIHHLKGGAPGLREHLIRQAKQALSKAGKE